VVDTRRATYLPDRLLLVALILLLYSLDAITGRINDPTIGTSVVERGMFYFFYFGGFLGLVWQRETAIKLVRASLPLGLLLALAFASVLWSYAPSATLARSSTFLCSSTVALYFVCRLGLKRFIETLALAITIAAAISLFVVIFFPGVGIMSNAGAMDESTGGAWRGLFSHKNPAGWAMVLGLLTISLTLEGRRNLRDAAKILAFGLCLFILVQSRCDNGMIVALVLALVLPVLLWSRARQSITGAFLGLLIVAVFVTGLLTLDAENVLAMLGRDTTLNGRTDVWNLLGDAIGQHPALGFGYGIFWDAGGPASQFVNPFLEWSPGEAHNGFIDIVLSLGVAGIIVFVLFLVTGLARAFRLFWRGHGLASAWPLFVMLCVIFSNFAESSFAKGMEVNWITLVASFFFAIDTRREEHQPFTFLSPLRSRISAPD
jgi:exopolysaccharide production protein ExoQ